MATATGSPCGACKFLRRKCAADCVFAPYFSSDQGPARFAAIHKVFGASNVSKMLAHVPLPDRCEAVVTIAYEAQARIQDPVYGCVAHIFALQQQVACLQAQVMQVKSQLAIMDQSSGDQWPGGAGSTAPGHTGSSSPTFQLPSYDSNNCMQEIRGGGDRFATCQPYAKRWPCQTDLSELQALAFRMMKNEN